MGRGGPTRQLRIATAAATPVISEFSRNKDGFDTPPAGKLPGSLREELRVPAGVRKSPRNASAGRRRWAMGISDSGRCRCCEDGGV